MLTFSYVLSVVMAALANNFSHLFIRVLQTGEGVTSAVRCSLYSETPSIRIDAQIVLQIILDEFKLGRFQSSHHRGCPDGHLQIIDGGLRGGQYCGMVLPDKPRPVFISESDSLTATLRFFQFYGEQLENNFSFRMRYKFLANETAKSRSVILEGEKRGCLLDPSSHQQKTQYSNRPQRYTHTEREEP